MPGGAPFIGRASRRSRALEGSGDAGSLMQADDLGGRWRQGGSHRGSGIAGRDGALRLLPFARRVADDSAGQTNEVKDTKHILRD